MLKEILVNFIGTSCCSITPQKVTINSKLNSSKPHIILMLTLDDISYHFPNGSKNTLSICHLTLMDALRPMSVPIDPVNVPILPNMRKYMMIHF